MEIRNQIKTENGIFDTLYKDAEDGPLPDIDAGCGAIAWTFCERKLVVVYYPKKGAWFPPGGGIEPGEAIEEAVVREVAEESNMIVLKQKLLGYQDHYQDGKYLGRNFRSMAIATSNGDFAQDPDGDISEIKLIDPADYKQYFDWGETGDYIMKRALEYLEAQNT